jgi:hypothetical protein
MTKTKLKQIMNTDAEIWITVDDGIGNLLYEAFDNDDDESESVVVFKVVDDSIIFDVKYVVFKINGSVEILFPSTKRNEEMLKEFFEFVDELNADFEEMAVDVFPSNTLIFAH